MHLYSVVRSTYFPVQKEWSWELFQAIEEHCKTDAAYASIRNVDTMKKDDRMESFFLAETLKCVKTCVTCFQAVRSIALDSNSFNLFLSLRRYLYLIQDNDNNLDLLDTVSIA